MKLNYIALTARADTHKITTNQSYIQFSIYQVQGRYLICPGFLLSIN